MSDIFDHKITVIANKLKKTYLIALKNENFSGTGIICNFTTIISHQNIIL